MKRTRRIEVITYTRRVTFVEGGDAPAAPSPLAGPPPIDINADAPGSTPPADVEGEGGPLLCETAPVEPPPGRPAFRLRNLLQGLRR